MILSGKLRLSDGSGKRTAGGFSKLIIDNRAVFQTFFGTDLFPGSLNVDVPTPVTLQADLDSGKYTPSIVVPKSRLINMPAYVGDGQAWPAFLHHAGFSEPMKCWVFRRVGSRVPKGVIELIAPPPSLRLTYRLQHGDPVSIDMLVNLTSGSVNC
jgi:CTP-dependent riboflavin kinase